MTAKSIETTLLDTLTETNYNLCIKRKFAGVDFVKSF